MVSIVRLKMMNLNFIGLMSMLSQKYSMMKLVAQYEIQKVQLLTFSFVSMDELFQGELSLV